jgi:hypothetical protein
MGAIDGAATGPVGRLHSVEASSAIQAGRQSQIGVATIHGRLPGYTTSIGAVVAARTAVIVETVELRDVQSPKAGRAAQEEQGYGTECAASELRWPDQSSVHQNPPANDTPA